MQDEAEIRADRHGYRVLAYLMYHRDSPGDYL
jgi:hypothetical protein